MNRFLILIFKIYLILYTSTFIENARTDSSEDTHEVTRDECINAMNSTIVKPICCLPLDLTDEAANTCFRIRNRLENEFVQLSIIVQCIYKKRNYIKSSTQLNMESIEIQAKIIYHQENQQNFMVDMYRTCGRNAIVKLHKARTDKKGKKLIKAARKPYFTYVFMCVIGYPYDNCPYFIWNGVQQNKELCANYAHQCKERYFENESAEFAAEV